MPIRVTVPDVWDEVRLELPETATLSELKRAALVATSVRRDPDAYVLKFRGAEMLDEALTLAASGLVPNAPVIVLQRRRRPLR
jgi:hypothetical protein